MSPELAGLIVLQSEQLAIGVSLLEQNGAVLKHCEEVNRLEPEDKHAMPGKVRYGKETYRLNKKTPARIAS